MQQHVICSQAHKDESVQMKHTRHLCLKLLCNSKLKDRLYLLVALTLGNARTKPRTINKEKINIKLNLWRLEGFKLCIAANIFT